MPAGNACPAVHLIWICPGVNTLDFVIYNVDGIGHNASGMQIQMTGAQVPESVFGN